MTKLFNSTLTQPKILYKYRDFENNYHKRLISNQELYFASLSELNDPFEGNAEVKWNEMTLQNALELNQNLIKSFHPSLTHDESTQFAQNLTNSKKLFHPENVNFSYEETQNKWNDILGIVSLTSKINDIHMWSIYANSHQGFIVGLNTESILKHYDFDYIGTVNYQDLMPEISFSDNHTEKFKKKFFVKNTKWKNEAEWRITKNHIDDRKVILKKQTIQEIIFGAKTENKYIEWTRDTIKKCNLKVQLKKANISNTGYKIDITTLPS